MTMTINPPVGATIMTHRGNGGIVEQLENERVIIRVADCILKSIPVTAIARWELPPTNPYPIGTIVHKRLKQGWMGIVLQHVGSDSVEVLWWLDQHPSLMAVSNLKLADRGVAESSLKAFARKGLMP